ncbi:hypothetical protein [Microbacterium sp. NIBRBAC000506063]|uniref:hypothetical protein n=1 Tax=Microbacterium sp. NIBRBAC000506063 TaxID=2734618 RepID=UPI001BB756F5|nr:hypothetical protein [Microbacterium sp. NIBRBAC000506063]QTV79458.1 hypothetical protein KAE78_11180 [Microbacterium sp. NIBRBAC000506063]
MKQPWAWAIAAGFKSVENRTRNIAGDYRGPVAIHAGRGFDQAAATHPELVRRAREQWNDEAAELFTGMPQMFGHILAVANLYAVHQHDGTAQFVCCPNAPDRYQAWAQAGTWHLCLASPRRLAQPLPYKGGLGLRRLDATTTALIEALT